MSRKKHRHRRGVPSPEFCVKCFRESFYGGDGYAVCRNCGRAYAKEPDGWRGFGYIAVGDEHGGFGHIGRDPLRPCPLPDA